MVEGFERCESSLASCTSAIQLSATGMHNNSQYILMCFNVWPPQIVYIMPVATFSSFYRSNKCS